MRPGVRLRPAGARGTEARVRRPSSDGFANVAAERRLGRIPVLLVRMNADLVMGEELKKTGAGNLFTVFGEPDIEIETTATSCAWSLRGVDVYDPNTGEIRSDDTDQIALWMIDTAYDGESLLRPPLLLHRRPGPVRAAQARAEGRHRRGRLGELYRTTSRPFPDRSRAGSPSR